MRKLTIQLLTTLIPLVCFSQHPKSNFFPDYYSSSILKNTVLINPAFIHDNSKANFSTVYKSRTGLLNEVSSFSAYADFLITSKQQQTGRMILQNEKEGPFISSPKLFANYAIKIPLSEDMSLFAGTAIGVSSVSFTAPSGMGKTSVPDGSLGSIFRYKKSEIGVASYQIFNSNSIAINSSLLFKRFYQFYIQSEKKINANLAIKGNLFWRPQPLYDLANVTSVVSYNDILDVGLMYQFRRGTSFLSSFVLNKNHNPINVNLSYNSLLLNSLSVSNGSFEIGLQYKISN